MLLDNLKNILLEKKQLQKLIIIHQLHSGSILISSLEKKCNVSRKELKRIITIVNEEMCEVKKLKNSNDLIFIKDESVHLNSEISNNDYCSILIKLRKKYLLSSSVYNVLLFTLEKREFTISDLSESLFYSDSYTYKIIKKLDLFFFNMESDIKLKKKDKVYIITGSEISIKIFHFLLAMLVSDENTWIFKNIKKNCCVCCTNKDLKNHQLLTRVNQTRLKILLSVFEASKTNVSLPSTIDINNRIGKIMVNEEAYSLNLGETNLLDNKEQICLSFLIHYFCQELRTKEQKIIIGKKLSTCDDTLVQLVVNFLNDIKCYFNLPDKYYYEILYTLYKRITVIHHLGLYQYMCNTELVIKEGKVEQCLERLVEKHFNKYKNEKSYSQLKCSLIPVCSSYIKLTNIQASKVYVEFNHYSEYRTMIINKLKLNYCEKILKVEEEYDSADIIIGDSPRINTDKKIFIYHGTPDSSTWNCLREFLNNHLE
ncbi:helix-turn-helix domain-containing protein [Candidatus Enterococcus ikei]|uniref:Helix-turn-helix domain-containing protein n=1 Tax=Candidatus Enterococcus ikei TaxID=2815326 RepID=A0ABS3H2D4_9ENTE|nr:helix-turn-helix domain-containing protein [Enterococcus sp. DIV0869a]MBO0441690.1 helix-turn-helix domain-containing protein [Enterococcus sp. DIV0869a]